MFETALLESGKHSPGTQRTVSTAASLLLQTSFLAAAVIVPLLASRAVPEFVQIPPPIWMPHLDNPPTEVDRTGSNAGTNLFVASRVLRPPSQITTLDRRPTVEEIGPVEIRNDRGAGPSGIPGVLGNGPGPMLPENPATKHPPV